MSTDPDRAGDLFLQSYVLNDEFGSHRANCSTAMFLAFHELNAGHNAQAAYWARRAIQLAIAHGPSYIAQGVSVTVPIAKRRAPTDAAVLLGALRAHRMRRNQTGTEQEVATETRQEASLRRALGDEFDPLHASGLALSEADMLALAFTQLDAIVDEVEQ